MKYPTALLLLIALLLTACGQKGPLFLPGEKPPAQQDAASAPADDASANGAPDNGEQAAKRP